MSAAHVWRCGRCGGRVTAQVGAILTAFRTHAAQCPARGRRGSPSTPPPRPESDTPTPTARKESP
jgi:hypothetical protein